MVEVRESGACTLTLAGGQTLKATTDGVPAPLPVPDPWTVQFPPNWGAPTETTFETLQPWTESADEGIKFFSGTARYKKELEIPAGLLGSNRRLYLDLGEVRDIAEVYLNGTSLGILWRKPFEVEISQAAKPGKNLLEIEIVNMWINRLTGDQLLPPDKRFLRTNELPRKDIGGDETWHIEPAGLLGPVRLIPASVVRAS
ncbi:MAG: hypothetical protein HYV26_13175 [Candidatus Hydrogenedentes bacterium]|nr:hypothetical protein [Candidatus Hydrogenedentota bacterium]